MGDESFELHVNADRERPCGGGAGVGARVDRYVAGLNPLHVAAVSAFVMLLFAFPFPVVGFIVDPVAGEAVGGYRLTTLFTNPGFYLTVVFDTSLHLSVQTFTTVGSSLRPAGTARLLVDLESLLGVALIGLLWASLIRS